MAKTDSLYKYTRLEYINSTLNNGIFASNIGVLNDPYEINEINNADEYKVVCLSRSRNKKLMWSHYADGHRGCSIKISVPKDYGTNTCPLRRVNYSGNFLSTKKLRISNVFESLYTKDKKWDYELEVRAVYCESNKDLSCWKKYRNNIFLRVNVTQIDFGCFSHFDPHYLDALICIRDYNTNHRKKIKVRKYKMSNTKYEFKIDKDFDYIKEISRIINEEN